MRVTQSMLSNNMLRNLNKSYTKMSKLQNQIETGSKITRPSDAPVIAVKGMGYRRDLNQVEQFTRNLGEVNTWLDTSNESLDQVNKALIRVKELIVQAANDTNTNDDREKINSEISQIKLQLQDIANTQVGGKYIFSGTKTNSPLFVNGEINTNLLVEATPPTIPPTFTDQFISAASADVNIEVFNGIQLTVNTDGTQVFKEMNDFMTKLSDLLGSGATGSEISAALGAEIKDGANKIPGLDAVTEKVLGSLADIGARQNRAEMMENRLSVQEVNVTKQLSDNEDVDYAAAITEMVTQESIHQAALSVGAKIIQQTLVDFIR